MLQPRLDSDSRWGGSRAGINQLSAAVENSGGFGIIKTEVIRRDSKISIQDQEIGFIPPSNPPLKIFNFNMISLTM